MLSPAVWLTPRYNNLSPRAGYYRVVYVVIWYGSWNAIGRATAVTGTTGIAPSNTSDFQCKIAACRANAGNVQIW